MRKILLSLVCLFGLTSAHADPLSPQHAFAEACHLSRYSCWGIKPPMVRVSVYVAMEEAYGIYFGGNTVWMSPVLTDPRDFYIVLVHEMVHYLQAHVDDTVPFGSQVKSCVYEEEAFQASDVVAARLNRPDMIRVNILRAYGCQV